MSRGWWRRNRWGLLLLVPAVGLGLAQPVDNVWHQFWTGAPRTPIAAKAGAWATLRGAGFRLDKFEAVTGLKDDFGDPVAVPSGETIWRASLTIRSPHSDSVIGCQVQAVDATGTAYDVGPGELADAGLFDGDNGCMPGLGVTPNAGSWTDVEYFVLPTGVTPTGLRVLFRTDLPKYVLLSRA